MKKFLLSLSFIFLSTILRGNTDENSESVRGGADEIEGWIIKRTPKGIVKIPKNQKFKFEGTQLEGDSGQPSTLLQPRLSPDRQSLIPIRKSFQNEFFDATGVEKRNSK